jgi:predicted aspartyl protease
MRIDGEWLLFDEGVVRPVIRGEFLSGDGSWVRLPFLVDTGADRTVLSAAILTALRLQPIADHEDISGLGGIVRSVVIETPIRFSREEGRNKVVFRGQYVAVTELETLDVSILGRDITDLFALIVDRPSNVVCLIGQRHRYTIEQQ